ncbi:hypothetical protein GCM10025868_34390 [Angustibacter aerolatus]|uniref:DNA 3'-5' helicase n=1 Tax=Angustibacter aerolatus TaxID=1162965 RepID=A0ABQ6JM42_9ACTN|nr:hypothetical protein GCM10025868_34390 [Angustibacter aerolatus]
MAEEVARKEVLAADGTVVREGHEVRAEPAEPTVVGDADQSIYAFRGASIRNIVEFESDYPDARTILLEQNYRSTQTILTAANAVIARNPDRRDKKAWTAKAGGVPIVGYVADSEHDEAAFVAEEVERLTKDEGVRPGDVAVFYRTNAQSRTIEDVLVRVHLPYKIVGGTRFYERREVKDAIAYLRVLSNGTDTVNLRRILNVPKRGIGDRAEAVLAALATRERIPFVEALARADEAPGIATRSLTAVRGFTTLLQDLRTLVDSGATPAVVLAAVLEQTGLAEELRNSKDPQDETRLENLYEPGGGRPRVRGVAARRHPHRLPRAGLAGRRQRRHPGRRGRRARGGDPDDAAHREGPGVPRRVPHRHGGGGLPAQARARRPHRAWRRSAGWPTSASPVPASGCT